MSDIPRDTIERLNNLNLPAIKVKQIVSIINDMLDRSLSVRGKSLPDSWSVSTSDVDYGLVLGLTEDEIQSVADDMRLWAGANSNRAVARKADWSLTFKSWLRREAAKVKTAKGKANSNGRGAFFEIATELGDHHKHRNGGPRQRELGLGTGIQAARR